MGNAPLFLAILSNFGQPALALERHSMTSIWGHRVRTGSLSPMVLSTEPRHGQVSPTPHVNERTYVDEINTVARLGIDPDRRAEREEFRWHYHSRQRARET